jgi:hypothetical protein
MSGESLEDICKRLEHFETPEWATEAILRRELLTKHVVDPCSGGGVLTRALRHAGYFVHAQDIHDWNNVDCDRIHDWLWPGAVPDNLLRREFSVFMNPPFSKAVEFVDAAFRYGARKVVCFQRFAWWESAERRDFWAKLPPHRVYICGSRADCWRYDLPKDEKGNRFDHEGKKLAGSSTAHAWFVWEPGQPSGTSLGHIYRGAA